MIDYALLRKIADERMAQHHGKASSRYMNADSHYIGLVGEATFALEFGLQLDTSLRNSGDEGIDFRTAPGTIDVKTGKKVPFLIVPVKTKHWADIYVLAGFNGDTTPASLVGWDYVEAVRAAPVRDFGYGIDNHAIRAESLQVIEALHDLLHTEP